MNDIKVVQMIELVQWFSIHDSIFDPHLKICIWLYP
jgi:hypothetical protein